MVTKIEFLELNDDLSLFLLLLLMTFEDLTGTGLECILKNDDGVQM